MKSLELMKRDFELKPFRVSCELDQIKNILTEDFWDGDLCIERLPNFWTIGMATYKDGFPIKDQKKLEYANDNLYSIFGEMYDYLIDFFEDTFRGKFTFLDGAPMPGFHVFKYCEEFTKPLARPHVDVPFNQYDCVDRLKMNGIFTFVAPVEVPSGAGMYVWNKDVYDMTRLGATDVIASARETEPDMLVEHVKDTMCIHSGRYVHMIKPFERKEFGIHRITFQGHAIYMGNEWKLYW